MLRLLHTYRVGDYGVVPAARRLLVRSTVAVFVMIAAIVALCFCSGIWWVARSGSIFALLALGKIFWAIFMRRSGRYRAFYEKRRWS